MPDDKTKRGKPDRDRVNLGEPYEVRDWCSHWGINEPTLRQAVAAAGVMVRDVEGWLRRNGKIR
jgi:hypothetical protein